MIRARSSNPGYLPGRLQRQSLKQARSAKESRRQRAAQPQVSTIRGRHVSDIQSLQPEDVGATASSCCWHTALDIGSCSTLAAAKTCPPHGTPNSAPRSRPRRAAQARARSAGRRAIIKYPSRPWPHSSPRLPDRRSVGRAVCLCITALEVSVRFCRRQGRAPRARHQTSAMPTWSVGSRELCQPRTPAGSLSRRAT